MQPRSRSRRPTKRAASLCLRLIEICASKRNQMPKNRSFAREASFQSTDPDPCSLQVHRISVEQHDLANPKAGGVWGLEKVAFCIKLFSMP
jgi:hypothetical protein